MAAISSGASRMFVAQSNGATFTVTVNGGGIANISGDAVDQIGPIQTRKTYGPFAIGQAITIAAQNADVIVEVGDASPSDSYTGAAYSPENLKTTNTINTRKALASSGLSRSIIQGVGDSFIQGRYSAGNTDVGARKFSWFTLMIANLQSQGVSINGDSVCGWGSVTPSTIDGYVAYDPRVSYTGTVTKYSGIAGLGYEMFQLAASATLTFTPGGTFDTVEVYWAAGASGATGTFTVSDAGGVKATIDCSLNPGAVRTQVVTLAAGSTYVTFTASSTCTIAFFKTRTSSIPQVEAINCGQAGKPMQQWAPTAASAPYGTQASLNLLDGSLPVVTIVEGWYNDLKTPRTLAQYSADLRAFCSWAKSKGDLWFVNYAKLDPSLVDESTFRTWANTAKSIVINEYDGVWIDASALLSDNTSIVSQGLMSSDKLHLQKGGHSIVAKAVSDALISAMALPQ